MDSPSRLIIDATLPCKVKHSLYSYKTPHQKKTKTQKSVLLARTYLSC